MVIEREGIMKSLLRAIAVTTGNLVSTGIGPGDYVFLGAENHVSTGAATLTTGNITAPGLGVTLVTTAALFFLKRPLEAKAPMHRQTRIANQAE